LKDRGLKTPLPHRLLWSIGVFIRPPHFASFIENFVIVAIGFGGAWGIVLLSMYSILDKSVADLILTSVKAGLMFGFVMALYWAILSRVHKLPNWKEIECSP
jgi:hypothetical protein